MNLAKFHSFLQKIPKFLIYKILRYGKIKEWGILVAPGIKKGLLIFFKEILFTAIVFGFVIDFYDSHIYFRWLAIGLGVWGIFRLLYRLRDQGIIPDFRKNAKRFI